MFFTTFSYTWTIQIFLLYIQFLFFSQFFVVLHSIFFKVSRHQFNFVPFSIFSCFPFFPLPVSSNFTIRLRFFFSLSSFWVFSHCFPCFYLWKTEKPFRPGEKVVDKYAYNSWSKVKMNRIQIVQFCELFFVGKTNGILGKKWYSSIL